MSDKVITGTITTIPPTEEISDGKYKKQAFVVSNNDGFEGKECQYAFELFEKSDGEKITNFLKYNKVGDLVDVKYEIRCNENPRKIGQWFTSLSAWRVDQSSDGSVASVADEALDVEAIDDLDVPF